MATAAVALSVASTAWACTYFAGQTYFDNPATAGTLEEATTLPNTTWRTKVVKGSPITVWGKGVATTENYPPSPWRVVASAENQCCGSGTANLTPLDKPYVFTASPTGTAAQLGPTNNATAPVGTGTFSVCWLYGDQTGKALNPATITTVNGGGGGA